MRLAAACCFAVLVVSSVNAQAPAAATDPDVLGAERLFTAWMESQIAYRGLPGIVVGVVADQDLVWAKGFGYADVAKKLPMTPATKFRMASHSKLFTATAIMQLASRQTAARRSDRHLSSMVQLLRRSSDDDPDGHH